MTSKKMKGQLELVGVLLMLVVIANESLTAALLFVSMFCAIQMIDWLVQWKENRKRKS